MINIWRNEQGTSLIELVVVIVIVGVALPSLLSLLGMVSIHSAQNGVMERAIALAETKMEEIIGKKEATWNWYKNTTAFEVDETLPCGYRRVVTVTSISNWGSAALNAWEVNVTVSHQLLPNGYSLVVRLTKFH